MKLVKAKVRNDFKKCHFKVIGNNKWYDCVQPDDLDGEENNLLIRVRGDIWIAFPSIDFQFDNEGQ
jgi:hypothetical protein